MREQSFDYELDFFGILYSIVAIVTYSTTFSKCIYLSFGFHVLTMFLSILRTGLSIPMIYNPIHATDQMMSRNLRAYRRSKPIFSEKNSVATFQHWCKHLISDSCIVYTQEEQRGKLLLNKFILPLLRCVGA